MLNYMAAGHEPEVRRGFLVLFFIKRGIKRSPRAFFMILLLMLCCSKP